MGGDGDSPPQCPTNSRPPPPQPEPSSSSASSSTRVPLVDSPILFLVCFHKAVRAELEDLRHVTSAALESGSRDRQGRGFVLRLLRRFEFLKLAYKYHCFAEDEVIFLALDGRTKNVASTYSLEHRSIDGLFDSIFNRLDDLLEESEDISKEFQELVFCVGTLQAFVCQHMLKEEELVFPLILEQFSAKEQASLVWEFLSSVPLMLLEDLLPWTISFLQPDEQDDFVLCIKEIVPDEKFLQEVVISWLARNEQTSGDENETGGAEHAGKSADIKKLLKSHSPKRFFEEYRSRIKAVSIHSDIGYNLVDGLHLWHGAIRKDLTKVLEELYQLKISSNFSDLDSIVVQLKFFVDILTFYRSALDKLFHPVLNELFDSCLYPWGEEFPNESHVEGLQRLLYCSLQNRAPLSKFVEKLCRELESFVLEINKHFAFQEIKVFPIVRKNCSHELQQQLFYVSLHILPLGLLRCMTTWFSACLSEDESKSIITSLNQGDSSVNKSFAFLLHEWFRIGRSGKTSVEKFGTDLQQIFKNRYASLSKQFSDTSGSSSASTNIQPCEGSTTRLMEPISSDKGKNSTPYPSSYSSHSARNYEKSYSTGTNPHTYFPGAMGTSRYFPESLSEENLLGTVLHEPEPIDLIFFFHKALKKDLEYLVFGSAQLDENITFLTEFCRRFHLVQFLYQIHSEAEDEVAFPALEGKGKLQNISHSYTMDHKLEDENFQKISLILEEISKLHVSVVRSDSISNRVDQKMPQHHRLCMKLHDMCKSMCKLLTEHIHREEIEIWPLFKESFSIKEQERIVGSMLGRTEAKILQDMLPWLMESLTPQEQQAMISLWRQVTRHTMFDEWLREWWEGYDPAKVVEKPNVRPSWHADPLEILSTYLCGSGEEEGSFCNRSMKFPDKVLPAKTKPFEDSEVDEKRKDSNGDQYTYTDTEHAKPYAEADKKCQEVEKATKIINGPVQLFQSSQKSKYCKCLLTLSQEDMEAAIRKISRDSSLDSQKKSYMIQNLLMSNWIVRRNSDLNVPSNGKEIPGQNPSYQDPFGLIFGCKHYKRNCKLLAACCNQLYTCIRCHDEIADHSIDRKSITEMMCMKCLQIQPVGPTCSTASCSSLSMARYFCRICKIFDDERVIYHCPYCNLCRLGKGLGIDYYHCMTCNACMSRLLLKHTCREKCFMDNCPICNEDIFTSNSAVKALPCGHLMHSICFEAYTCTNYTCPICGKSLGDMQVYFQMLDAFLAEERTPDEYSGQTQVVLCNDCEKKGTAPFHWLYHKCSSCGSYNTRLL